MRQEIFRKECKVLKQPKSYGPVAKAEFGIGGMSIFVSVYEDKVNVSQQVFGKYNKLAVLTADEPSKKVLGFIFSYDNVTREIIVEQESFEISKQQKDNGSIKIFSDSTLGEIRVSGSPDDPLFCLADICKILGLTNPSSVAKRIDEEYRAKIDIGRDNQAVGNTIATFVTEPGLYSVILGSDSKNAKPFKKWVFEEVLPAIRKTGGYVDESYKFVESYFTDLDEDTKKFIAITLESKKKLLQENAIQMKVIECQKPKVDFYDAVAESNGAKTMEQVSKILSKYGLGRNRLFEFLRSKKVLNMSNIPYQKYMNMQLFKVVERSYNTRSGSIVRTQTLVYQKGIDYISKLLKQELNY